MQHYHRQGSVDLLVVILILVVAVTLLLLLERPPEYSLARAAACKANLKGIGCAMLAYQEITGSLPLIKPYEAVPNGTNSAPTEANQTDYKLGDPRAPEDEMTWEILGDQAMQNVWLSVAKGYVDERLFKCPGDTDWQPRDAAGRYGWTDPHQYSYGMHWPYATDADGNGNPAPLSTDTYRLGVAIFADQNPGGPVGGSRSPSNHPRAGTNYVFADGTVRASRDGTSTFGHDEIYTNEDGLADGLPQSENDTSIALSGR